MDNVVKVNVFLSNFEDFQAMNEVYKEVSHCHLAFAIWVLTDEPLQYFDPRSMPARTCVQVAVLPLKAAVEIECVAALP